jgi:hypothetical protein
VKNELLLSCNGSGRGVQARPFFCQLVDVSHQWNSSQVSTILLINTPGTLQNTVYKVQCVDYLLHSSVPCPGETFLQMSILYRLFVHFIQELMTLHSLKLLERCQHDLTPHTPYAHWFLDWLSTPFHVVGLVLQSKKLKVQLWTPQKYTVSWRLWYQIDISVLFPILNRNAP